MSYIIYQTVHKPVICFKKWYYGPHVQQNFHETVDPLPVAAKTKCRKDEKWRVLFFFSSEGVCTIAESNLYQCFTSNANSVTLEQELSEPTDPSLRTEITDNNHNRMPDSFTRWWARTGSLTHFFSTYNAKQAYQI